MMNSFSTKEIEKRIFLLNFHNEYDMCMHFLRYQEFYESPNPDFRGKQFTILEFMRWYSKKYGKGAFTYPVDWAGFNIPAHIVTDIWNIVGLYDRNPYDENMWDVFSKCLEKYPDKKFYIIGASNGNKGTIKHEVAHGLFYVNDEYKKEVTKLVKALPIAHRKKFNKFLKDTGYASKVFVDETQAYMVAGISEKFGFDESLNKQFVDLFKKHSKGKGK